MRGEVKTKRDIKDKNYLRLTFKLAKKAEGKTALNPLVGCVIVKNNKIISTGYHKGWGKDHAEIDALKKINYQAENATLYINLEPCCHYGKTPPCTEKIIKSKIKKVVASIKDPNPLVNGKGFKILKKHGIKIKSGILAEEAKELNKPYLKYITTGLPYCVLKIACSFDGKIATKTGNSKWITSKQSRTYVYKLRSKFDAILTGANTIIKDNPSLTTHGYGRNPLRIILDPELSIPQHSKVLNDGNKTIIVTSMNAHKKLKMKKNVEVVRFRKNRSGYFDLKTVLKKLAKMYNLQRILVEAGGITNALALKSKVIDELLIFFSPIIIGGKHAITSVEGEGIKKVSQALKIKKYTTKRIGNDLLVRAFLA